MDYSKITLMSMMKTRMGYLAERLDTLAQNVANADTPGYRPKDLKKLDFAHLAMIESSRLQMRATQPGHQAPIARQSENFKSQKMKKTYETTPVRNRVSLEEQMALVSQTQIDYQTTTNLYKKTTDLFKVAVGNK